TVPAKIDKQDSRWWNPRLTYLESKDGVHWQRPKLKLVPWKGHAETNILLDGYNSYASVNIDPTRKDAPYEMFAFRWPGRLGEPAVLGGLPLPPARTSIPTACTVIGPRTARHGRP